MRDQAGRSVGRRRGIDDIAADGRLRADLVVGKPHRAARHGRQSADERGIVEEALDWRGGAKPHARVTDGYFTQFRDFRDVDQHRDMDIAGAALARPGQRIGRARDDAIAPAMCLHRGKGLAKRARRQIFVAGEHRRLPILRCHRPRKRAIQCITTGPSSQRHGRPGHPRFRGATTTDDHSAATFCAASIFAFTTTLMASSTRSLA